MLPKYPQQLQNPYYAPQYQQRIAQLEAQQSQQYPQYDMYSSQQTPTGYLKGRPVVSLEEARAAQIDLDGSLFVFTDIANNKIYTKQINLDGIAVLKTYSLVENSSPSTEYVTKSELDKVIASFQETISKMQGERNAELNESTNKSRSGTVEETVRKQPTF